MPRFSFFLFSRINITVIIVLSSFYSFAQIDEELNRVLIKRNFTELVRFVNKSGAEDNGIRISKGNFREIVGDFSEALFYLIKRYPVNRVLYNQSKSRVRVLTKGDIIIYYYFEQKHFDKLSEITKEVIDTIYQYSNEDEIAKMNVSFQKSFLTALNTNDLFIDTIYYGQNCGHGPPGMLTDESVIINNWVKTVDTTNLKNWLQSANVERQVYAVYGFYTFLFKGVQLNENVKQMIASVRKKKGKMNICSICDSGQGEISDVIDFMIKGLGKQQNNKGNASVK